MNKTHFFSHHFVADFTAIAPQRSHPHHRVIGCSLALTVSGLWSNHLQCLHEVHSEKRRRLRLWPNMNSQQHLALRRKLQHQAAGFIFECAVNLPDFDTSPQSRAAVFPCKLINPAVVSAYKIFNTRICSRVLKNPRKVVAASYRSGENSAGNIHVISRIDEIDQLETLIISLCENRRPVGIADVVSVFFARVRDPGKEWLW